MLRVSSATAAVARVLLIAFLVILGLVVFLPSDNHAALGLVARAARYLADLGLPYSAAFDFIEFGANIVLFIPLGILLPLSIGSNTRRVYMWTVGVGLVSTLLIEVTQLGIPGRVTDVRDLVANTLGAFLGVLIVIAWRKALRRRLDQTAKVRLYSSETSM